MPIPRRRASINQRILVVEPLAELRLLVQEIFETEGYRVVSAANSAAARDLSLRLRLDAAVIEVMLSDECGTVLGSDLDAAGVPVLMMTGHPDGLRLLDSLPLRRIHKPFHPDALIQCVEDNLSNAAVYRGMARHEC
jgi:DNA-binding response OmpR family regulator